VISGERNFVKLLLLCEERLLEMLAEGLEL
jgi:hypothetical protein